MTRAQTVEVLNDTTTIQSRIDTVLAAPDLDWSNDSGWQPGDPLYVHPWEWDSPSTLYVRQMVEVVVEPEPWMRCQSCEVSWSGAEGCWICGNEASEPEPLFSAAWGASAVEAMREMSEQFAEMQRVMRQAFERQLDQQVFYVGRAFQPEPEPEPVVEFREDGEYTATERHGFPSLTLALNNPDLYRRQSDGFYVDRRPATETRRPRRTA